jgi:hypothetical protein
MNARARIVAESYLSTVRAHIFFSNTWELINSRNAIVCSSHDTRSVARNTKLLSPL